MQIVVLPSNTAASYGRIFLAIQVSQYISVLILNVVIATISVISSNFKGIYRHTIHMKSLTIVYYVICVSGVWIITKGTCVKYIKCPDDAEDSCLTSSVEHGER